MINERLNGREAVSMLTLVVLCLMLPHDGNAYSVEQPPPPPILSSDNEIPLSKSDEGFHFLLGAMLSLNSDTAFPRFIGPSSNPLLSKDPRSLTEARTLGLFNWAPSDHSWAGSLAQSYLMQVRVALNKRWSVFMDKNGYSFIDQGHAGAAVDGWNNLAFGAKYLLIRDVEQQFLVSGGLQWELPTGEADVFQRPSDGSVTGFLSVGKEFCCFWHLLGNVGARAPLSGDGSTLFYSQLHLDRECMGWLHPLVEVNYYRQVSDGNRQPLLYLGQADALIDWSMPGTVGSDLVTIAVGFKAKCNRSAEVGVTYERPITETDRIMEHRIIAEFILRY